MITQNAFVLNQQITGTAASAADTAYQPPALDPLNSAAVFADFAKRLQSIEQSMQASGIGKDGILSQIAVSKEAILIESSKVGILGQVTFADYLRDQNGQSTGVLDPSITRIRGGVIQTEMIESADTYSFINLDSTVANGLEFIRVATSSATSVSIRPSGAFTFGSAAGSQLIFDPVAGSLTLGNNALMNGTIVSTVVNNAAAGASASGTANAAYNLASSALQAGTTYVLGGQQQITGTGGVVAGNITWNTSNGVITGGSGVAITQNGLIGAQNGVSTFSITNAGVATFAGNLTGGANINITGAAIINGDSNGGGGNAALSVNYYGSSTIGIRAYSGTNSGILGEGTVSNSVGVYGINQSVGGIGVAASAYSGTALQVLGNMTIDNSTLVSNLNAQFWNGVSFNTATTGSAQATFATANKPGGASSNTWLPVTGVAGNVIGYLPFWT